MSYASIADMVSRFGEGELIELTDRQQSGSVDVAVLQSALDDATAKIDGYISSRVKMPLASVPQVLVAYCCDMARYALYDDVASETVVERYKEAIKYLRDVAHGSVKLESSSGQEASKSSSIIEIHSGGTVFDRDKSKGFI